MAGIGKASQPGGGEAVWLDVLAWATTVKNLSSQWVGLDVGARGNNYLWTTGMPSGVDGKGVTTLGNGSVSNIEAQAAGTLKLIKTNILYQERYTGANALQVRLQNITKAQTIYQRNITPAGSAAAYALDIQTGTLDAPLASHSFANGDKIALQVYATIEKVWNVVALFVGLVEE